MLEPEAQPLFLADRAEDEAKEPSKFWTAATTAVNEWQELPAAQKTGAIIRGLGCGAMAGTGLSGLPVVAAMVYPFNYSAHIPPVAAAETFAVSLAWGVLDANVFKSFFGRFRRTAAALGGDAADRNMAKILPGLPLETEPTAETKEEKRGRLRPFLGKLALRYARGATVQSGLGTAAYMAAGTVQGKSDSELRTLGVEAAFDSALYMGSIMLLASGVADLLAHQDPAVGNMMLHYAKNFFVWLAVPGAMTTYRLGVKNLIKKLSRRESKQLEPEMLST